MTNPEKTGDNQLSPTQKNVSQLIAEIAILKAEIIPLTAQRDEALSQLKQANDLIESDTKAGLIKTASELSTMTVYELAGKDIAELETIISVSKLTKKQNFESGGDVAAARPEKFDRKTHLHTKYVGNKRD